MTDRQPAGSDSRFVTGLMLTIGVLFLTLCGTCTLYVGGSGLWSLLSGRDDRSLGGIMLVTALVVGGLPSLGGLVLVLEGLKRLRRSRPPPPGPPAA
jgi:hypothetical protein